MNEDAKSSHLKIKVIEDGNEDEDTGQLNH